MKPHSPPKFKPNDLVRKKSKQTTQIGYVCYVRNDEYEQETNWKKTPPEYYYAVQFRNGTFNSYVSEQTIERTIDLFKNSSLLESQSPQTTYGTLTTASKTRSKPKEIESTQKPLTNREKSDSMSSVSSLSSVSSFSGISTHEDSSVIDSYECRMRQRNRKKKKCFWNWGCCNNITVQ